MDRAGRTALVEVLRNAMEAEGDELDGEIEAMFDVAGIGAIVGEQPPKKAAPRNGPPFFHPDIESYYPCMEPRWSAVYSRGGEHIGWLCRCGASAAAVRPRRNPAQAKARRSYSRGWQLWLPGVRK